MFKITYGSSVIFLLSVFACIYQKNARAQCTNADFENGNLSGWTGTWSEAICSGTIFFGQCFGGSGWIINNYDGLNQGPDNQMPNATPQSTHVITTSGYDPIVGNNILPMVNPGGNYSARLGNAQGYGMGESLTYTFIVTEENANFTYSYAVVLNDGGHSAKEQPFFKIRMTDSNGDPIDCAAFDVDASTAQSIGGFINIGNDISYKPWTSVFVPLASYIGETVSIQFITHDCTPAAGGGAGTHWAYAYIDAECSEIEVVSSSPAVCGGQPVTLTAPTGAASYSWTGPGIISSDNEQSVSVDEPGQYVVTMTTFGIVPCPFSMTIDIAGNPNNPVADFSNTTVCQGNATVFNDLSGPLGSVNAWSWDFDNDGNTDATSQNPSYIFPEAGNHSVALTATWGDCTNTIVQEIEVLEMPLSTFSVPSSVCLGFNSLITYTGNAPADATYAWSFDGGTIVSGSSQGPYEINWATPGIKNVMLSVDMGSCTSTQTTIPVTVNDATITVAPSNPVICDGTSVIIQTTSAGTYQWFYNDEPISEATQSSYEATLAGEYYVQVTNESCTNTSDIIAVNTIDVIPPMLPSNFSECEEVAIALSAAGNFQNWQWLQSGSPVDGQTNATYNFTLNETVSISVIVSNSGCEVVSNEITITAIPLPVVAINPTEDITVCEETIALLANSNVGDIQWLLSGEPIDGATNTTYTATQDGDYSFISTVPGSNCSTTSEEITVIVDSSLEVAIEASATTACSGETIALAVDGNFDSILWSDNSETSSTQAESSGLYSVVVTSSGCTAYDEIQIVFYPMPTISAGNDTINNCNPGIVLTGIGTGTLTWEPNATLTVLTTFDGSTTALVNPTIDTYYTLTATNGVCTTSDQVLVEADCSSITIPNIFTPNGDGSNDTFEVQVTGASYYHLRIFNRWGDLIWESKDPMKRWNGSANQSDVPDSVYYWLIEALDFQNRPMLDAGSSHGSVMLVR